MANARHGKPKMDVRAIRKWLGKQSITPGERTKKTIYGPAGSTLMHFAAAAGRIDVMEWLKDNNGLKVDAKNKIGHTPMYHAAANGHIEAMMWLKENGAAVDVKSTGGSTPMYWAAANGHVEAMAWLKENGAEVDVNDTDRSLMSMFVSPMFVAAANGDIKALSWLKDNGAEVDTKDGFGRTPLDWAKEMKNHDAAQWLEKNGGK